MKPNNEPAFPGFYRDRDHISQPVIGMTLRDYFAGQALSGIVINAKLGNTHEIMAKEAYSYADAMLIERNK